MGEVCFFLLFHSIGSGFGICIWSSSRKSWRHARFDVWYFGSTLGHPRASMKGGEVDMKGLKAAAA